MAHLLGAEALHLEYPTRVVFDSVTVGIGDGDRIGIVGRNGDGKTTLLRLLAGRLEPDAGRVTRKRGIRLGMLDQADAVHSERTVHEVVIGDIDEHVWAGDARARDVIAGLIADIPWEARVDELSGGQRRRVALAALLIGEWDVLFLDEPSTQEPYLVRTPPFYRSEGRSRGACRPRAAHRVARLRRPARSSGQAGVR